MPKDRSSLCIGFNSNYSMKIRQCLLFKIKNLPLRNCIEREKPFILFWKRLRFDWGQRFEVCFLSHGDSEFFVCPTLVKRRKDIFLYFFTELKPYHLSHSISKLFIFYITGSSEDACSRSSEVISCRRLRQQERLSRQFWWNF